MPISGLFLVAFIAVVTAVTRIVIVSIALKGVQDTHRAAVLRGLAECFRWWRPTGRGPRGS